MKSYSLGGTQALELRDALNRYLEGPQPHDGFDIEKALGQIVGLPQTPPHVWVYSPALALKYIRTHARQDNVPPQHVRCQWVKDGIRCRKGEGHENLPNDSGHEEPK